MTATACVYTCLFGGYETLNEQPMARQSTLPFICFTDDPALKSETWRIVQVAPAFPQDPVRSQRLYKLQPYRHLPDIGRSLYIDNSVVLTAPPERVLDRYLDAGGIAVPTHSFRERVLDEFVEVAATQLDDSLRITEQLASYEASDPETLQERPYWSGVMLRDHHDARVAAAMEIWALQVLRYARRDQLSVNVAFRRSGLSPRRIEIDNYQSWFHRWPVLEGRKTGTRTFSHERAGAEALAIRVLERELIQHRNELARSTQETQDLHQRLATAGQETAALIREAQRLAGQVAEQAAHVERLRSSLSWKVTAPLRAVRGLFRARNPGRTQDGD